MTNSSAPHPTSLDSAGKAVPAAQAGTDHECPSMEVPLPDRFSATGFVIELPLPPSVNSTIKRLGNKSPGVARWRLLCDGYIWPQWRWLKPRAVTGAFLIDITWTKAEYGRSDIDNRIKPLLDYLQAKKLIENDKHCKEMRVGFGETKYGCRVEVLPRREVTNG